MRNSVQTIGRLRGRLAASIGAAVVVLSLLSVTAPPLAAGASGVSLGVLNASFYANPTNSGAFTATPSDTPAFTQTFAQLDFNPPAGTVPCTNSTGVDVNTRPFTDVIQQSDGSCSLDVAQGNAVQAGVGTLSAFDALFEAPITVAAAGNVVFSFFSDDGWVMGIGPGPGGAQPGYVSGPFVNAPSSSPFEGYHIVGSYNQPSAPAANNLTVDFPAAGTYPVEFDYTECCGGQLSFTLQASGAPIPPSATMTLAPATATNPVGSQHTVTATLKDGGGSLIDGATVLWSVTGANSSSGSGTTDANGQASFTYTGTSPGEDTITACYDVNTNGVCDSGELTASATKTWLAPTTLTVSPATGDVADPTTVSAVLTNPNTSAPVPGEPVTLTLNGTETCTGTTDVTGTGSCSIVPGEAAGPYTLAGSFAGDSTYEASSGSANFVVTLEETALSYTGDTSAVNGQPMTLSGVLTTDDPSAGTALAGKTVSFSLGSGGSAQTCTGTTDASGTASCTIAAVNQTVGSVAVAASFGGDTYYQAASASASVTVFAPPATGAFVIGDVSAGSPTVGADLYFWGSQWARKNHLSGGTAPSSMKGFADSPQTLACGSTWTTSTGNSSAPPATLPARIEVIVSDHVTQSGSVISGTVVHIVLVQVDAGYRNDPGHNGTGTIIGVIC